MASLRMLLSAVSLSITMLLWPQAGSGSAKSCAENMNEIYERVSLRFIVDGEKVQEFINDSLPAFKAACPTEAKSIKDLEDGRYLRKLVAEREKRKKALRHIKATAGFTGTGGQDEDLEDLEIQR
jgi:hypothetical protein